MSHRVGVNPPPDLHAIRPGARRGVLSQKPRPKPDDPSMCFLKIRHQKIDVHLRRHGLARPGRRREPRHGLEGQPLSVGRRLERHPTGVPLHRITADHCAPEGGQRPRIGAVENDLADPADRFPQRGCAPFAGAHTVSGSVPSPHAGRVCHLGPRLLLRPLGSVRLGRRAPLVRRRAGAPPPAPTPHDESGGRRAASVRLGRPRVGAAHQRSRRPCAALRTAAFISSVANGTAPHLVSNR